MRRRRGAFLKPIGARLWRRRRRNLKETRFRAELLHVLGRSDGSPDVYELMKTLGLKRRKWLIRPCQHRRRAPWRVAHAYAHAYACAFCARRRWAGLSGLSKEAGKAASCAQFFYITVCALINRRGVFIHEAESRKQEGSIQWLAD